MIEPKLHYPSSPLTVDFTGLKNQQLDKSWVHEVFDNATMDVVHGTDLVARFRPNVFSEEEIRAAWKGFPDVEERDVTQDGLKFLRAADHLFTTHCTYAYAKQSRLLQEHKLERIQGTAFTSARIFRDVQVPMWHHEGFVLIAVLYRGMCKDDVWMLPEFSCGFQFHSGDLLIVEPGNWVANSEITDKSPSFERLVVQMESFCEV